jgi:hypothetical protein
LGQKSETVDVVVESQTYGWDINPRKVTVNVPKTSRKTVAFLLNLSPDAQSGEAKVSLYINGNEIDKSVIQLTLQGTKKKLAIKVLGNVIHSLILPYLWSNMRTREDSILHMEVVNYVKSILAQFNLNLTSPDLDKARAILEFVVTRMGESHATLWVPGIEMMIGELKKGNNIDGDCKTFSVLYGGLAKAAGINVRLVAGVMEYTTDFNLDAHVWTEVYINGKWIFVDPQGIFNDTRYDQFGVGYRWTTTAADNIKFTDPKKFYDSNVLGWGGPLYAIAYDGNYKYDVSQDYRYELTEPVPLMETVVFVHSPVNLSLFDEAGNFVCFGAPFTCMQGGKSFLKGQFIILPKNMDKFKVKLEATSSGNLTLGVYKNEKIKVINTFVEKGQTLYYYVNASTEEISINPMEAQQTSLFNIFYIFASTALVVLIALILTVVLKRRRITKKNIYNLQK